MIRQLTYQIMILWIALLFASDTRSQQLPVYSGYNMNQYVLNPAVAGSEKYIDFRLLHRSQWMGFEDGPSTQLLSGHSSIDKRPIGVGGYFYNDRAGVLGNSGFSFTFAYHLQLSGKADDEEEGLKLSFGLSGSVTQYRLYASRIRLIHDNDQLINMTGTRSRVAPNASFGTYLYSPSRYYVGISMLNMFSPNVLFFDAAGTLLTPHYYVLAGITVPISRSMIMEPSCVIDYVNKNPTQADLRLSFDYNELFRFGAGYRTGDAVIFSTGVYLFPNLGLNYAYDLTLSSMRKASSGSHEIMLKYIVYYKPIYKKERRRYKWIDLKEGEPEKKKSGENMDID